MWNTVLVTGADQHGSQNCTENFKSAAIVEKCQLARLTGKSKSLSRECR